jgi:hypothetical protein
MLWGTFRCFYVEFPTEACIIRYTRHVVDIQYMCVYIYVDTLY